MMARLSLWNVYVFYSTEIPIINRCWPVVTEATDTATATFQNAEVASYLEVSNGRKHFDKNNLWLCFSGNFHNHSTISDGNSIHVSLCCRYATFLAQNCRGFTPQHFWFVSGLSLVLTLLLRLFSGVIIWIIIGVTVVGSIVGMIALWYVTAIKRITGVLHSCLLSGKNAENGVPMSGRIWCLYIFLPQDTLGKREATCGRDQRRFQQRNSYRGGLIFWQSEETRPPSRRCHSFHSFRCKFQSIDFLKKVEESGAAKTK